MTTPRLTAFPETILDLSHTGGREVLSDIVVPDQLLTRALVIVTDDDRLFEDDDDDEFEFEDGGDDVEGVSYSASADDLGPLWIWRRPRPRKG